MIDLQKLEVANNVLSLMKEGIWFSIDKGYLQINWRNCNDRIVTKRWMCAENFYPPYRLPTGGTYTQAIACLAQWVRGQICYPLATWKYWCTEAIGMTPTNIPSILEAGGYPVGKTCGFCGKEVTGSWDWYFDVGVGCLRRSQCENYKQEAIAQGKVA
jgi:hypothetical protein